MEYFILFVLIWLAPIISSKYFLTQDDLLLMSPLKSIIMPYIYLGVIIYVITALLTIIRAIRVCKTEQNKETWWGVKTGLKLGILTSIFGVLMYLLVGIFPVLTLPFLAISILPRATQIGE